MTQVAILESVQVGSPGRYNSPKRGAAERGVWETSFFRSPSPESRWLHLTHLDGNAQADTVNHGKPEQAVLLYASAHYPVWRSELDYPEIGPGGFAENFTVDGLDEETACIGDVYAIGDAQIRVTGPRFPCWKVERRWDIPGLTARVAATGRTGWYCRALREGTITPGSPLTLVERPFPQWSVALTNDLGHGRNRDVEVAQALAKCPLLDDWWGELVVRRATGRDA